MSRREALVWLASLMVVAAAPAPAGAQAAKTTTEPTAQELSLQFAVPASPAFKLVEVDASSVLRPTSFHQFASTLSDLGTSGGSFAVPKELGFELAPFFLSRGSRLSLTDYRKHAGLYRFRVSGAYRRGTGVEKPTLLSLGLRFAPRDASDPRMAPALVSEMTRLTADINAVCAERARTAPSDKTKEGEITCADPRANEADLQRSIAAATDAEKPALEKQLADFRRAKAERQVTIDAANARIKQLKAAWTDSAWNKSGFELALAGAAQSADTLGRHPQFRTASAWASAAAQLGAWGQFVAGANVASGRDSIVGTIRQTYTLGIGLFVGSDHYKGFVEGQASGKSAAKSAGALFNAGGEVSLAPGLWAVASEGWTLDPDTRKGRLVSHFSLRTKFPLKTPNGPAATDPDDSR
jgi:hypothetical protein